MLHHVSHITNLHRAAQTRGALAAWLLASMTLGACATTHTPAALVKKGPRAVTLQTWAVDRAMVGVVPGGGAPEVRVWPTLREAERAERGWQTARDTVAAATMYRARCGAGDARACARLGALVARGVHGGDASLVEARALYKKSCDEANPAGASSGCAGLGALAFHGRAGEARDVQRAAHLFERACKGGEARGCVNLAALLNGEHLPRDEARATRLRVRACAWGHPEGCVAAGVAHLRGIGTRRDVPRARRAFLLAHVSGSAEGAARLGMTHLPEAPGRAIRLLERACAGGYGAGCVQLADAVEAHTPGGTRRAHNAIARACDTLRHPRGCARLAALSPPARAVPLATWACAQGDGLGCTIRARQLRHEGRAAEQMAHLRKGCDLTHTPACVSLGRALLATPDPQRDAARATQHAQQARALFTRACSAGAAAGCVELAALYRSGRGGRKSTRLARRALRRACKLGAREHCTSPLQRPQR